MSARIWLVIGALTGAAAVGLGAYGAHGLETRLDARSDLTTERIALLLQWFDTAVRYQMFHTGGLLVAGLLARRSPRSASAAGILFVLGLLLFSGSFYGMVLADLKLAMVLPIGGLTLMVGWVALAVAGWRAGAAVD